MRITIFIGGLSGGGAERVCCNIADFLSEHGHKITIVTMADDKDTYGLNPKITRLSLIKENERKGFIYNSIIRYRRLYKYVNKTECDAYVVMLPITIMLLLSLRKNIGAKIITSERNMPTLYPSWQQKVLKWVASKSDGWVFQTCEQQEWYGNSLKNTISAVIPNAINNSFIRDRFVGERDNTIVTVGRLTTQKNQAILIKAFAKLNKVLPHYELHIYGEGPLKSKLMKLAEDLNIKNKVHFDGFVKDVYEHVKKASLFVLSSDYEGIPNALMEAMAMGLPCVSTDCYGGGARLLIDNNRNGIIVEKGNVDTLAQAMIKLLLDKSLADSLGEEAHNVTQTYHPTKIYNKWESFIEHIIKN